MAFRIARQLGVTADYLLDESAPYPPPAREVLENLRPPSRLEREGSTVHLSPRELRLVRALRILDSERGLLLETILNAPRKLVRHAVALLGKGEELPGVDEQELKLYE